MNASNDHAPLVRVDDLPIAQLIQHGDMALARSIERVTRDLDDPNGVIAAFSSYAAAREQT